MLELVSLVRRHRLVVRTLGFHPSNQGFESPWRYKFSYTFIMDPNLPQINLIQPKDQTNTAEKISETPASFIKSHYETYLRFMINFMFSVLNFIKSSITNIISQVTNKE